MFDDYQICPYTGLRSFTEEESLYFKGREEHIEQATEQLQRNKFLMLTGASGDGKSSLVYAGIIPNARAGFLKSRYTQWCVADFRPERSPFKNLCKSVARQLGIANTSTVESELQHGFSALADLYRSSPRNVDLHSNTWLQADESSKAAMKREAANLIILVDQFEEFFTNPENYHRGIPSRDSNLVLNILLETARIALEEDLPIYVIFTMRSDFIGQCAAFRSLPEYIGFSQFFVPRLNRSQLQQVIEEPASLSGNRISRRLTERLIHDIAEGVDQLPILQHALNQIWHAADHGKEEMDLLHYVMVGGMSPDELPDDQTEKIRLWFKNLPDTIKQFYREPNLQNVVDTHANKLFESAGDHYFNKTGKRIPGETIKTIIKITFACLTKIDQSRAVRNRMTLAEITNILGLQEITSKEVGDVLSIFREPGNTFIRPFITDDPDSISLKDADVLDITHESLIRNWEYLEEWAKQEYDDYTISLDFEQQLNRWVESGKSSDFLLSIGPLTYFESWYHRVDPNAYWIARYLPDDIGVDKKLTKANQVLFNAQEFLKRSARKHMVTRAFVRYGSKRIAAVIGILALILFSSFMFSDYLRKQNSFVLKSIAEETLQLANNRRVAFNEKSILLCEELRLGLISLQDVVNCNEDPIEKINVIGGVAKALVFQGRNEPADLILKSLSLTDSLLGAYPKAELNAKKLSGLLEENNDLAVTLDLALFYNREANLNDLRSKNARRGAQLVLHIINSEPTAFNDMRNLAVNLDNAVNTGSFSGTELEELISALSPFTESPKSPWYKDIFKIDNLLVKGGFGYGFKFNGLYQELAYLYAATGNSGMVLRCVDSLMRHNSNYFANDYGTLIDNASNIASVFFLNKKTAALDDFVKGYCARKKITEVEFYNRLICRFGNSSPIVSTLHFHPWMTLTANLNLRFPDIEQISFFSGKFRESILKNIKDQDKKNLYLAVSYKNEGLLISRYSTRYGIKPDKSLIWPLFDKAFQYFSQLKPGFLDQELVVAVMTDIIKMPNKTLFIYPDFYPQYNFTETRTTENFYSTYSFLEYVLEKDLFKTLYQTEKDLENINRWLPEYESETFDTEFNLVPEMDQSVIRELEDELSNQTLNSKFDLNLLCFYLGRSYSQLNDTLKARQYYSRIKKENLIVALRSNGDIIKHVAQTVIFWIRTGHFEEAYDLIRVFKNNTNRSNLYAYSVVELSKTKFDSNTILRLLDSARAEMNRTKDLTSGQPNREQLAYALAMNDPEKFHDEAYRVIKNIWGKTGAIRRITRSYGFNGKLYDGMQNIPPTISDTERALCIWNLLYGYQEGLTTTDESWQQFSQSHRRWIIQWVPYVDDDE